MRPLPALLAGQDWVERLHQKDAGVPYGIALAAAALAVYPDTPWMKALGDVTAHGVRRSMSDDSNRVTNPLTRFGYASLTML